MPAIALNTYKTVRSDVTTGITTVYTAPTGVSSIILYSQVANVSAGIVTLTAYHGRGGNPVELFNDFEIPANDSLNLVDGRLVLEGGDTFELEGSSNGTMRAVLSILESAK
jgi:hypothetical protein